MKKIAKRWTQHPRISVVGSNVLDNCDIFTWGYCRVLREQHAPPFGWHLSISCAHRYPTWEEIKAARYDLLPHDVTMAMILPPPDEYVNVHVNCFHLHQIPNEVSDDPDQSGVHVMSAHQGLLPRP